MKILWLSKEGDSLDLCARAYANGHEVRFWVYKDEYKDSAQGLLPKINKWQDSVSWCDWVMFDATGMSDIWKKVHKEKPCFGGGDWADKLEQDRPYAKDIFKQMGLKAFESVKVNTIDEAIKHVTTHKVKHVVKPVGANTTSHHVTIGEYEDGKDVADILNSFKDQDLGIKYLEIEERKSGIEVGVSGWFIGDGKGGGDWSGDININFEHKRYATGYPEGMGPLTGETGTAMVYDSQQNEFFKKTLAKIKPFLQKENYRGQIDVSFMVNDEGVFPLEATPRLGYPACFIEQQLQNIPFEDLFYATACGHSGFKNEVSRDWAIGVVVMSPGFPSIEDAKERSNNLPIFNWDKYLDQVHLLEAKGGKNYKGEQAILTDPGIGLTLVVSGLGKTIEEAKRSAYRPLSPDNKDRVYVPSMYYRTDIGDRVIRQKSDISRLKILPQEKFQSEARLILSLPL